MSNADEQLNLVESLKDCAIWLNLAGASVQLLESADGVTLIASAGSKVYEPQSGGGWHCAGRADTPEQLTDFIRKVNARG